ncbi:hypothetical protein CRG98_024635 [Punica granatum]|uniref:Uncharacterized protein n=1 Tax=Punica granatum TaxID=22663 RepID=A0A2I0JG67_PUNGR|nr:hypothetical protein CRG98_024635 [Punica granatum]
MGSNVSKHRPRGLMPPCTQSACNPSTEWGLSPSHHSAPSNVYVKDDSNQVCESRLDITRERERSNDYRENQSILSTAIDLGVDHYGPTNCDVRIANRPLDAQTYSSIGSLARSDHFIEFTVSKRASQVQLQVTWWRLLLTCVRCALPGRWTLPSSIA